MREQCDQNIVYEVAKGDLKFVMLLFWTPWYLELQLCVLSGLVLNFPLDKCISFL